MSSNFPHQLGTRHSVGISFNAGVKFKREKGENIEADNTSTFEFQKKAGAVVCMEKLNANTVRSRRVDVTFTPRRPTNSISGPAADGRATSGERLVDKRVPAPASIELHTSRWRDSIQQSFLKAQRRVCYRGVCTCMHD